ncbi:MAG TPA: preprotein translocase subunit SecG, partial [Anaerolineales bacterium]|nr:preprotein translocase subunit SecG [Anaerolineales bacterium]
PGWYNGALVPGGIGLAVYFSIAMLIVSVALIVVIVIQRREAGLGGLTGAELGGAGGYHVRRGLERLLFNLTIALSVVFFGLALAYAIVVG